MTCNNEHIVKTVLEECKVIQKNINEKLMADFGRLHNIKPEFNIFEMKQEILAKSGYFFNVKKRYMLHMVNKEGVDCDEYELRGIYLRRSEYPEVTKEKTQILLDMLLKNEVLNIKEIIEFVDETREYIKTLIKQGNKSTARIASFKKDISEYKVVSSFVEGMVLWNEIENHYFYPGSKGFQFKIKGIDPSKAPENVLKKLKKTKQIKNIVIPWEVETLPDYYIIDVDEMLDFAWNNRMDEILAPLVETHNYFKSQNLVTFDLF